MSRVVSSVRITAVASEERIFWREVQQALAGGESEEMREERDLWDATVKDGLREGRWS